MLVIVKAPHTFRFFSAHVMSTLVWNAEVIDESPMWYVIRDMWYVPECCSLNIYRRKTLDLIFKIIQHNPYFIIIIIILDCLMVRIKVLKN